MLDKFKTIVERIDTTNVFVIDASIPKDKYISLDFSIDNKELGKVDVSSSDDLEEFINNYIEKSNAEVAFGGYLETRGIYTRSEYFNDKLDPKDERNIHLGVDVWAEAETKVLAALDGEIHSFDYNANYGDYGPTIILKHEIEGIFFYTLYGHLSLESLYDLEVGETVKKGEEISQLGTAEVNGDYPPHLHFQIILDIEEYFGDYPGVASQNTLEFYKQNCPDPNLLLGLK